MPADRPYVTCLMTSSLDGRLHPSCYTTSPDGDPASWGTVYEAMHDALDADAWLVGRVTMAEMAQGADDDAVVAEAVPARPIHKAAGAEAPFAIAPDTHARLAFAKPEVGGDAVIVLLGSHVADEHLARLAAVGVSYIVAEDDRPDLAAMLRTLRTDFGVERLALEGGGGVNGAMIAAGLVDELHIVMVPAIDGDDTRQGIVIAPHGGLKGKVELAFIGCEARDHGTVLLRYRVTPTAH